MKTIYVKTASTSTFNGWKLGEPHIGLGNNERVIHTQIRYSGNDVFLDAVIERDDTVRDADPGEIQLESKRERAW